MLTEVSFGPRAIAYIRTLLEGGTTLSRALARLPLEAGRVVAFLPETSAGAGGDGPEPERFDAGGVTSAAQTEPALVRFVADALVAAPDACLLLEDAVARPQFPYVSRTGLPYLTLKDEVYWVVSHTSADGESVRRALRQAASYRLVGALTEASDASAWNPGQEIPAETIEALAGRARHILAGAFDGEAVLIWSAPS
jgi:hypothetical protein